MLLYKPNAVLGIRSWSHFFYQSIVLHTRGPWKFSLADIKKMFCRSDLWSKSSHVLVVAAWNVFPIHSLMPGTLYYHNITLSKEFAGNQGKRQNFDPSSLLYKFGLIFMRMKQKKNFFWRKKFKMADFSKWPFFKITNSQDWLMWSSLM